MSELNSNLEDIEYKDVKKYLIGVGIYEKGMTREEMMAIYKVFKQSEKVASEQEYRDTLAVASKNEADLSDVLSENRSLRSSSKSIDKPGRLVEDNNNLSHERNDYNIEKLETSDASITNNKTQIIETNTKKNVISAYNKKTKNIDVFSNHATEHHIEFVSKKPYKHEDLPFHCRPDILKWPKYFAVQAIMAHQEKFTLAYQKSQRQSMKLVPWAKPIPIPTISINKTISENLEISSIPKPSENEKLNERSRRNVKRKNYSMFFIDDENLKEKKFKESIKSGATDQQTSENKQEPDYVSTQDNMFDSLFDTPTNQKNVSKYAASSDDETSTQLEVQAMVHNDSTNNHRWSLSPCSIKETTFTESTSEDKSSLATGERLANKVNRHDEDKIEIMEDNASNSNGDEKLYPRRIIPPNPYRDKVSARTEQKIKNASRRRNKNPQSFSKPENQDLCEELIDETDQIFTMPLKPLSGNKLNSTQSGLRSSTLKKKITPEENELIKCPLCSKSFPSAIIQGHAATCAEKVQKVTIKYCKSCDAAYKDSEEHVCEPDRVIFSEEKK